MRVPLALVLFRSSHGNCLEFPLLLDPLLYWSLELTPLALSLLYSQGHKVGQQLMSVPLRLSTLHRDHVPII